MTEPLDAPGVGETAEAVEAIARLSSDGGPVMFFQSGGCCDGSLPMCFRLGEFIVGERDVLLGTVSGAPFYIDHRLYEAWNHPRLILDVADGEPEGFSLPAGPGRHFVTRVESVETSTR